MVIRSRSLRRLGPNLEKCGYSQASLLTAYLGLDNTAQLYPIISNPISKASQPLEGVNASARADTIGDLRGSMPGCCAAADLRETWIRHRLDWTGNISRFLRHHFPRHEDGIVESKYS